MAVVEKEREQKRVLLFPSFVDRRKNDDERVEKWSCGQSFFPSFPSEKKEKKSVKETCGALSHSQLGKLERLDH